jgi:RsiW-degrading membrane proteinase PrsW (M82 family)
MEPFAVKALVALAPVVVCIIALERLDAFRLVSFGDIVLLLGGGGALAAISYYANGRLMGLFPAVLGFKTYSQFGAPIVEEGLKCLPIILLFALNRVGYMIDAAIAGFAVGAGFALVENLFYLQQFANGNLGVWIVRGLGTAVMHGGASAIFAVLSMVMYTPRLRMGVDRFHWNPLLFMPGLAGAVLLHGAFNHFSDAPEVAMAVVLGAIPLSLFFIFAAGETQAHRWLALDHEGHAKLLRDMETGTFAESPPGRALAGLASRMNEPMAEALRDYVRTNVELVVTAENTLLALEAREKVALGASVREKLQHMHALERRLGHAPVMAVRQHLRLSREDLWKIHELEMDSARKRL